MRMILIVIIINCNRIDVSDSIYDHTTAKQKSNLLATSIITDQHRMTLS